VLTDYTFLEAFLRDTRVRVEWRMPPEVWRRAALAYRDYARRRRRRKGDAGPRRILADFLIGAHASAFGQRLLTFDGGIYQQAFPELGVRLLSAAGEE
jgi:predicted nucleic acid-binding protein